MEAAQFLNILEDMGAGFFAGVPDSLLKPFTDEITCKYGVFSDRHIVAANEGAAAGLAAGHYLATGKPAAVYMQNSGLGNAVNPICSLLHDKVYSIPVIFVIGWRGEPGVKDEPQHIFQGEITLGLLGLLEIPYVVLAKGEAIRPEDIDNFKQHIKNGRSIAFVVRKGALESGADDSCSEDKAALSREAALESILGLSDGFVCVCTTGKLSREVFEIREQRKTGHNNDFLTVGSMGHSISIAQGIAREKPQLRILCLDGDGAALMHMGSLAVAGTCGTANLVHIVLNNGAHESVGGMPTVCSMINLYKTAETLGYKKSLQLKSVNDIKTAAGDIINAEGPVFAEIICSSVSRGNLGRPAGTPAENKKQLEDYLRSK